MADIGEKIQIIIESFLDDVGFRQAEDYLKRLSREVGVSVSGMEAKLSKGFDLSRYVSNMPEVKTGTQEMMKYSQEYADYQKTLLGRQTKDWQNYYNILADEGKKFKIAPNYLEGAMKKLGAEMVVVGKGAKYFDAITGAELNTAQVTDRIARTQSRFRMEMLNVLFMAMQLRRTFENFLKSALSTYEKIAEGQTQTSKAILAMRASWTFFQFAMVEALGGLIEWFAKLFINIVDFLSANPTLMKMIGVFMGLGAAIAFVVFWGAQIAMFMSQLPALLSGVGLVASKVFGTSPVGLAGMMKAGIVNMLAWLPMIAFIGYFLYKTFENAQGAIYLNQKATLAAQEQRWDDYATYVIARNILLGNAIKTTFVNIFTSVMSVAMDAFQFILEIVADAWSWIPGIGPKIAAAYELAKQVSESGQKEFLKRQGIVYEKLNEQAAQSLIEMKLPFIDVINAMEKVGMTELDLMNIANAMGASQDYINKGLSEYVKQQSKNIPTLNQQEYLSQLPVAQNYGATTQGAGNTEYNYNPTYNIEGVSSPDDIQKLLDEHDAKIMNELERYG